MKVLVYSGLYPVNNNEFEALREALAKLKLNDSSFTYTPENSEGLGFGFRCGFLGMLHREIIGQRLERDCELDLVHTAPNVTYQILKTDGEVVTVNSPADVPDGGQVQEFREPIVRISFLLPSKHIGDIMKLRKEIDRHMFEVALQAAIGTRVIARETIAAMRKNVTAKCYGGDITRKRKLWAKQAKGKKRMKQVGQVEIPQEAFLAVLESDD